MERLQAPTKYLEDVNVAKLERGVVNSATADTGFSGDDRV